MKQLKGNNILLRLAEVSDAELILTWENMPEFWAISEDTGPYQLDEIQTSLAQSHDLVQCGQVRWIIYTSDRKPVGVADLFNFDAKNKKAGVGVLIGSKKDRGNGLGKAAVHLLLSHYAENNTVETYECMIHNDNLPSLALFQNLGFQLKKKTVFKSKEASVFQLTASHIRVYNQLQPDH